MFRTDRRLASNYLRLSLESQGLDVAEVVDVIEHLKRVRTLKQAGLRNTGYTEPSGSASWRIGIHAFETDLQSTPTLSADTISEAAGTGSRGLYEASRQYLGELGFRSGYKIRSSGGFVGDEIGYARGNGDFFVAEGELTLPKSGKEMRLTVSMRYNVSQKSAIQR
ncbi:MAG: hypothetical protein HY516_02290 [Candidatus Aenigmarchaeota archaeon]|nr:hypothetical protein [Candidatus Aenigmarchaeota archaeon]